MPTRRRFLGGAAAAVIGTQAVAQSQSEGTSHAMTADVIVCMSAAIVP